MGVVKFKAGTAAAFALLESKDNDTLYIITDEKKIYKGNICLSSSYKAVAELPGTGEINTIYVNTTDGSVAYWNGTGYQTIVKATATALTGTGDNLTFPTTKAVIDYITEKVSDLDVGALEGRVSTIEGQITTINGTGEGSIKKALSDAKAYADSLAPNYAAADHDHTLADITDAGALAGKSQVAESDLDSALAGKINGKADKATTLEGYGITDAYTKTAADSAIAQAVANADHLKREIVEFLPEVGSADEHTIYMVGDGTGEGNQKYEEFMLINGAFEKIGDSAVDLTGYATETFVTDKIGELDVSDAAVANQYVTQVVQTDGKISVTRADLPVKSVTEGSANGTIAVNGADINVHGLKSAAYADTSAFDAAGAAAEAETNAKAYTDTCLTWGEL